MRNQLKEQGTWARLGAFKVSPDLGYLLESCGPQTALHQGNMR